MPDFIQVGQWVKVLDWCGRIVDIASSEKAVMVQIESFKGIWNHHPTEWLKYEDGMMRPAGPEEIERDRQRYIEHLRRAMTTIESLSEMQRAR